MVPRITQRNESKVIGIEVRSKRETEASSPIGPELWDRFHQERERIPHKKNQDAILGVYTNYHGNPDEEFSLVLAAEVTTLEEVPSGMVPKVIPAGKYLIFSGKGPMPQAAFNTWDQIRKYFSNGTPFKRAYAVDFELYDTAKTDEVEIHVAVF